MPLTRIKNTAIGDDEAVTTQKLDDTTGGFTLPGIQFVKVPVGTTAQRATIHSVDIYVSILLWVF